jgi:methylenetetrahydrofolate dehydrogenase (NADP+)/methenyltetrahydrofolate cyclohydrolase
MALLLDGKVVRDSLKEELQNIVSKLPTQPTLVILQVGERPDSTAYITQKKRLGEELGVLVVYKQIDTSVTQKELLEEIEKSNSDDTVHGIILQIPLPEHLNKDDLLEAINPLKDVDGLTSYNIGAFFKEQNHGHIPATARGIMSLLHFYKISVQGKRVVIVGRSSLVGKPAALAFLKENATVTIAHKHTKNLTEITRDAEILVIAIGSPEFITKEYVSKGQIVIDVGINRTKEGKLVGDVRSSEVEPIVDAITPVPGGIGPMTVISLFQNVLDAYEKLKK